jgi:acetamidase/formamidase
MSQAPRGQTGALHELAATPETIHWGYFDHDRPPVLRVQSGDLIAVEALTGHAGEAPDLMMDDRIRTVYERVTDRGPGPHLLTGPVWVVGAEPGDALVIEILELRPRHPYGSNVAGWWGYLYDEFGRSERITIYHLDGERGRAHAAFAFEHPRQPSRPGLLIEPGSVAREPALAGIGIPLRPHFGCSGVAPAAPGRRDTTPPGAFGGNIDNRHFGPGTRMWYPVQVPGALWSAGDPHAAEGDGEINGTAIEASLNSLVRVQLHKRLPLPGPLLESPTHWMIHGFGEHLDAAMRSAALATLAFLTQRLDVSEWDAYSLMSVGVDFAVTQVVNTIVGVHARVAKQLLPALR